jgi:hypothetical protein
MGTSTVGDLQALVSNEDSVQIEPWLLREVMARTASPDGPTIPSSAADASNHRRLRAPTTIQPVWRTMMIWGTSPNSQVPEAVTPRLTPSMVDVFAVAARPGRPSLTPLPRRKPLPARPPTGPAA